MEVLKINGIEKQFPSGLPQTLAELLKQLGVEATTIVAEIDGQIVERNKFDQTRLHKNQTIELVKFVSGG